jgi:hypothetical protein
MKRMYTLRRFFRDSVRGQADLDKAIRSSNLLARQLFVKVMIQGKYVKKVKPRPESCDFFALEYVQWIICSRYQCIELADPTGYQAADSIHR